VLAYNVGTGVGITISELIDLILQTLAFQYKTEVHYTNESWKGDLQNLVADITKLRMLGFKPKVALKTGLKRFINWYNDSCSLR
jgi:nucleoside-diphosphate-sugar epimerase